MKLLLMCLVFFCFVLVQDFFVFARPNPEETSSLWSFWPFSSGGSTTVANEPAAIAPEEAKNDRNSLYRLVQTALGGYKFLYFIIFLFIYFYFFRTVFSRYSPHYPSLNL